MVTCFAADSSCVGKPLSSGGASGTSVTFAVSSSSQSNSATSIFTSVTAPAATGSSGATTGASTGTTTGAITGAATGTTTPHVASYVTVHQLLKLYNTNGSWQWHWLHTCHRNSHQRRFCQRCEGWHRWNHWCCSRCTPGLKREPDWRKVHSRTSAFDLVRSFSLTKFVVLFYVVGIFETSSLLLSTLIWGT